MTELPSRYDSKAVESKWYALWEKSGYFTPAVDPKKKAFTIVIPPPNVTGILHMGHALNNTIQDILIRWRRMSGDPTLWVPGVDHAGIATQNVVEKKLAKEGKTRHQLGREKFVEAVWKWKEEHGSTIVRQLRRLGASCDWTRERFTMDEGLSRAVQESFVTLYERGLIYRGDYIINWCPRCQTALSDEEAVHREIEGALYYIKYPIENSKDHITLATTRPETMLGDTAVAINPKDERYKNLRGKKVILPLLNRVIPVIEDDFVDPDFGTGIVKVTPAHDPNDFAMGARHKLPIVNVMNPDGMINEHGGPYQGLDRFEARKRIVHDLENQNLFVKRVSHGHAVGHCYRCHTIVEPYLSKQWFVKMKPLAEKALKAHLEGKVKFYPERWNKVYVSWLENIRDWCISRQIWWGHQIPVWYCEGTEKCLLDCKKPIVSRKDPTECPACGSKNIKRDPDVLDTWFSSWLWPFSTLGWPPSGAASPPDRPSDLEYFYPTSTLVTAQEIIFFWVARMIMAGLEFLGEVPFQNVFIHGTVRVEGGQKMSKSLGNIIDPLEIIDEMGADALRFSLMMLAATDVYLSREKFEMGRNFTNKIWNATRFVMSNVGHSEADVIPARFSAKQSGGSAISPGGKRESMDPRLKHMRLCRSAAPPHSGMTNVPFAQDDTNLSAIDKWILTELDHAAEEINECFKNFRFNEAANVVYHFFWSSFCDWYLELVKAVLQGKESPERKPTVQAVLVYVLERSMRLLHPFMPFISEEIWHLLKERIKSQKGDRQEVLSVPLFESSIMLTSWPSPSFKGKFEKEVSNVQIFQDTVVGVRDLRTRLGLKPNETLPDVRIGTKSKEAAESINEFKSQISFLARVSKISVERQIKKESGMIGRVYSDVEIFVAGLSLENLKAEEERTQKKIAELEGVIHGIETRLSDSKFVSNAPGEVVEKERTREEDLAKQLAAYRENLNLFRQ